MRHWFWRLLDSLEIRPVILNTSVNTWISVWGVHLCCELGQYFTKEEFVLAVAGVTEVSAVQGVTEDAGVKEVRGLTEEDPHQEKCL